MTEPTPIATHAFDGDVNTAVEFLKRTRSELRNLRMTRVWVDRVRVYDINGDCFEITGIGYPDADVVPLLNQVNTNYKPELLHAPTNDAFKEFKTGRRYPWAQDRVM